MKEIFDFVNREKKAATGKMVCAGVVGGILALAGLVTLCCLCKKKRCMKELDFGMHQEENKEEDDSI